MDATDFIEKMRQSIYRGLGLGRLKYLIIRFKYPVELSKTKLFALHEAT